MKERHSYCLKQQLSPGKVPFLANYEVPSLKDQDEVPRECVRTPFYREHGIALLVLRWNVPDSMAGKPLIG